MSMGKISPTAPEFGHDFLAENGPKNHNQNMVQHDLGALNSAISLKFY